MTKKKKIVRLAVLRSDDENPCPFGLSIPSACRNAGDLVDKMAPLAILGPEAKEKEMQELSLSNNRLFMWANPEEKCKFAGKTFESNEELVDCIWNELSDDIPKDGIPAGSPFYARHFSGIGLDGLHSWPLGGYRDNSIDRGFYYGMYSIESTGSKKYSSVFSTIKGLFVKEPDTDLEWLRDKVLYHGSKQRLDSLTKQQASAPWFRPGPEHLNAIYLTPSIELALTFGARPPGQTDIDHEAKTIRFENPDAFDPDEKVYIYGFNGNKILDLLSKSQDSWKLKVFDNEKQVAINLSELTPDRVDETTANMIFNYFKYYDPDEEPETQEPPIEDYESANKT